MDTCWKTKSMTEEPKGNIHFYDKNNSTLCGKHMNEKWFIGYPKSHVVTCKKCLKLKEEQ
jgi:hypothetical protein